MHIDHHPLVAEFPTFKHVIHSLKQSDAHFARLFQAYEVADKAVVRVENGSEVMSDLALEDLKKQLLSLKDQLYQMMQAADFAV